MNQRTDRHSTAGRAPRRVGVTRTVPPGRPVQCGVVQWPCGRHVALDTWTSPNVMNTNAVPAGPR
jgi:hypothetical protein